MIKHYFDDSNKNIFDLYKTHIMYKLFKVFPETIYDICDHQANPNGATGTLNPIMVDVNFDQNKQIKVLTYNILHDHAMKGDERKY